jgi:hypothetical protein
METIKFKTSLNNQWSLDWLKTQVDAIKERISIMIWKMCHIKGGYHPNNMHCAIILTSIYLLHQRLLAFQNCNACWKMIILLASLQKKKKLETITNWN